jgi:hypothetical protein
MRSAVSKSGGNASLAEGRGRYVDAAVIALDNGLGRIVRPHQELSHGMGIHRPNVNVDWRCNGPTIVVVPSGPADSFQEFCAASLGKSSKRLDCDIVSA